MIRLNNKGQSLVMFIFIIPIIILVLILIVDVGNAINTKNKIDNINYMVMEYALSNKNSNTLNDEIIDLINKNIDGVGISIDKKGKYIYITISKKINGVISDKTIISEVKSSYKGYNDKDKKIIERE